MISILNIKESINFFFIFVILILTLLCLYLFNKNKSLKKEIESLKKENKKLLEKKVTNGSKEDLIPIKNISTEKKAITQKKEEIIPNTKQKSKKDEEYQIPKNEKYKAKTNNLNTSYHKDFSRNSNQKPTKERVSNPKNYQRNTLENRNRVTSPIAINKEESFDIDKLSLDLNEFIKKSKKIVPQIKETNKDYLKEISNQMAKELEPQTIELTSYEKAQEENAIISYQELLSIKDKITIEDDEEDNINFIDELKKFRNNLD